MHTLSLSLVIVLSSWVFSSVFAGGEAELVEQFTNLDTQSLTILGTLILVCKWMMNHVDGKDKTFADLVAKTLEVMREKDAHYEKLVQQCREENAEVIRTLKEMLQLSQEK